MHRLFHKYLDSTVDIHRQVGFAWCALLLKKATRRFSILKCFSTGIRISLGQNSDWIMIHGPIRRIMGMRSFALKLNSPPTFLQLTITWRHATINTLQSGNAGKERDVELGLIEDSDGPGILINQSAKGEERALFERRFGLEAVPQRLIRWNLVLEYILIYSFWR